MDRFDYAIVRPTRRFGRKNERGASLLETLIAVGIAGFVASMLAKTVAFGFLGAKSSGMRQDIISMQQTLRSRLNCAQTLGVAVPPARRCSSYNDIVVKDSRGTRIPKLGDWTIRASCVDNALIFTASRPGNDPLTGKPRNAIPTNQSGATVATDLFGGTGQFCADYFGGARTTSCPPGQVIKSIDFETKSVSCGPGYEYGGSYAVAPDPVTGTPNPAYCQTPNNMTGSCACPSGFNPVGFHEFVRRCKLAPPPAFTAAYLQGFSVEAATCTFYTLPGHPVDGAYYGRYEYSCVR